MRRRPRRPPTMEFFDASRSAPGRRRVVLQLDSLEIEISGLDDPLADLLLARYDPYAAEESGGGSALRVGLALEETDYFIDPPETYEFVRVLIACDGDRVRYLSYRVAGWFDTGGGRGQLLLASGEWEPPQRSLENFIRAAVAWQAACRGGSLVHAASAVLDGKGYLFYGESGAGKSTLSECNRRARVVSDDLSLVLPGADGGLELIGSPFRGTYTEGEPVVGRFPLVAGFRLVQDARPAVTPVPRLRGLSELVGNLPFVAEGFCDRPDLFARIERSFSGIPLSHLHFCRDDSYWDAIRAAGF